MSAFFPSRSQHFSPAAGFFAHQETMGSLSPDLMGLIGSLACHIFSLYFFNTCFVNYQTVPQQTVC